MSDGAPFLPHGRVWIERAPPQAHPLLLCRARESFGNKPIVQRSITNALRGSIHYDWAKEGLVVTLKIDPKRLAA